MNNVVAADSAVATATDNASGAVANAAASTAAFGQLGSTARSGINLTGGNTEGRTAARVVVCLTATETDQRFLAQILEAQIEIDCENSAEGVRVALESTLQINGAPPRVILHEVATTSCNDAGVTSLAFPGEWRTSIPGFRHGFYKQIITPDAFSVATGDEIKLTTELLMSAILPAGATFASIDLSGSYQLNTDFGVTVQPCDEACTTDQECMDEGGGICEHQSCRPFAFFDDSIGFAFSANGLDTTVLDGTPELQSIRIVGPKEAFGVNVPTTPNQGIGTLTGGPFDRLINTTSAPNTVYVDLDGNASPGPADVIIVVSEGASERVVDVTIPDGDPTIRTLGAATVRTQVFPNVINLAQTGVHRITATITSVDPDSSGPRPPPTKTFGFTLENGLVTVVPAPLCGNGVKDLVEECDDGNAIDGDGCSATCRIEPAEPVCGDGLKAASEECDDGNASNGDGCSATCTIESGFLCVNETGRPSRCQSICGDGMIVGTEECDDGNRVDEDGCSAQCRRETCGDGVVQAGLGEACDDGNIVSNDGCSATCQSEPGFTCSTMPGQPTSCSPICGDGLIRGAEECDDGNTVAGDGCDPMCKVQFGYSCSGEPSVCTRLPPLITFKGSCVLSLKPGKDGCAFQGEASSADVTLDPTTEGVTVRAVQNQLTIFGVQIPPGAGWKKDKKGRTFTFTDDKNGSLGGPGQDKFSLKLNDKKKILTAKSSIKRVDLPPVTAGEVTITVAIGNDVLTATRNWILDNKGKKLTTP